MILFYFINIMIKIYILILIVIIFYVYLNSAPKKKEHFYLSNESKRKRRARDGCYLVYKKNNNSLLYSNETYELTGAANKYKLDYRGNTDTKYFRYEPPAARDPPLAANSKNFFFNKIKNGGLSDITVNWILGKVPKVGHNQDTTFREHDEDIGWCHGQIYLILKDREVYTKTSGTVVDGVMRGSKAWNDKGSVGNTIKISDGSQRNSTEDERRGKIKYFNTLQKILYFNGEGIPSNLTHNNIKKEIFEDDDTNYSFHLAYISNKVRSHDNNPYKKLEDYGISFTNFEVLIYLGAKGLTLSDDDITDLKKEIGVKNLTASSEVKAKIVEEGGVDVLSNYVGARLGAYTPLEKILYWSIKDTGLTKPQILDSNDNIEFINDFGSDWSTSPTPSAFERLRSYGKITFTDLEKVLYFPNKAHSLLGDNTPTDKQTLKSLIILAKLNGTDRGRATLANLNSVVSKDKLWNSFTTFEKRLYFPEEETIPTDFDDLADFKRDIIVNRLLYPDNTEYTIEYLHDTVFKRGVFYNVEKTLFFESEGVSNNYFTDLGTKTKLKNWIINWRVAGENNTNDILQNLLPKAPSNPPNTDCTKSGGNEYATIDNLKKSTKTRTDKFTDQDFSDLERALFFGGEGLLPMTRPEEKEIRNQIIETKLDSNGTGLKILSDNNEFNDEDIIKQRQRFMELINSISNISYVKFTNLEKVLYLDINLPTYSNDLKNQIINARIGEFDPEFEVQKFVCVNFGERFPSESIHVEVRCDSDF